MARKFIPDGDGEFSQFAQNFTKQLNDDADRFGIAADDARSIDAAVAEFLEAYRANANRHSRSMATVARKDAARADCERLIRRAAHLMRTNEKLTAADRVVVGVRERPSRLRKRDCPQTRPVIHLAGGMSNWDLKRGITGTHVIHFYDSSSSGSAKPEGAVRLELFVDLIAPDEPVPDHSGQRHGGMMFYLRSYTRSPMRVEYPKRDVPMRVVYWARWASATGETGPFSRTLETPIDGLDWSKLALPAPSPAPSVLPAPAAAPEARRLEQQRVTITSARRELPDCVETIDTVQAESSRLLPDQINEAA